jgi:HEPN domain-containing protein
MNKIIAKEWLKAANDDLVLISNIIDNESLTHLVAFHCQQAIEKSFKSVLEYNTNNVPKRHDLLMLKDLVFDQIEVENEDMLEALNSLYTESRYPGDLGLLPEGKPTIKDAEAFYDFAKNIYAQANELLI